MSDFFMTVGLNLLKFVLMTGAMVGGVYVGKWIKSIVECKKQRNK